MYISITACSSYSRELKMHGSIKAITFSNTNRNIGTLSVQELFFQLIGWLGVELGVSPVGMVYFMG